MFPLPSAWTLDAGTLVLVISGAYIDVVCSSLPHRELEETVSVARHMALLIRSQARWARVGVMVKARADKPGL